MIQLNVEPNHSPPQRVNSHFWLEIANKLTVVFDVKGFKSLTHFYICQCINNRGH